MCVIVNEQCGPNHEVQGLQAQPPGRLRRIHSRATPGPSRAKQTQFRNATSGHKQLHIKCLSHFMRLMIPPETKPNKANSHPTRNPDDNPATPPASRSLGRSLRRPLRTLAPRTAGTFPTAGIPSPPGSQFWEKPPQEPSLPRPATPLVKMVRVCIESGYDLTPKDRAALPVAWHDGCYSQRWLQRSITEEHVAGYRGWVLD